MLKKITTLLTTFCLSIAMLVGCSQPNVSDTDELDKITIAEVAHSVFYAPQYAAITMGFFEEEGIEIDLLSTPGADKTMAALISDEAQVGLMGPEASIYIYKQGSDNYAINFAQLTQTDGSFIISREDIKDFEWSDLEGKEMLGGRKGGVPYMTLEYVIKQNGLTIGTDTANGEVNVRTDVDFAAMNGAFAGGEADFTTAFEPSGTSMEKSGVGYVVASVGEGYKIPFTAYSATTDFIEGNEDLVQRFTNAIYKGQLWVQDASDEEIAKAMQPFFNDLSLNDLVNVVARYREIDAWCTDPILEEEELNTLSEIMIEAGELDQTADYDALVNTDFANEAINGD